MTQDKLADKIQKLMNLASSSNAHEAAAAMEKATELMSQHGLSPDDLKLREIKTVWFRSRQTIKAPKDFENALVWAVASAFGCTVLWRNGDSSKKDYWGRFGLVGHARYIEVAQYTAEVLLKKVADARVVYSKQMADKGYRRSPQLTDAIDSFCLGWSSVVREKVQAFASDTSAELKELVAKAMAAQVDGKDEVDSKETKYNPWSAQDGADAAKSVDIHRPMQGAEGPKLLG
jgi:hypothetical protein